MPSTAGVGARRPSASATPASWARTASSTVVAPVDVFVAGYESAVAAQHLAESQEVA